MNYVYIYLLIVVSLFFRSFIRILYPNFRDSDTYFHLYLISILRNKKKFNFLEKKRFIKPSNLYYPWLVHKIITYFPEQYEPVIEKFFNPVLDSLYVVLIYLFFYNCTLSNEIALYGALLYLFSPITFTIQSMGPRTGSLTPRLFGEITGSMYLWFNYLFITDSRLIYFILASILVVFVMASSRFSLQAIIFISSIAFLLTFNPVVLYPLITGIFLFLLVYRRRGIALLKNHLYHIIIFYRNNREEKSYISATNSFKVFLQSLKSKSLIHLYTYILNQNTVTGLVLKFPIIILFFLLSFQNNLNDYLHTFSFSGIIIFLLTSTKFFLFLGEPERYINHVITFILFICAQYLATHLLLLSTFLLYGSIFMLLDIYYVSKHTAKNFANVIIKKLKTYKKSYNVFSIPMNLSSSWKIIYETNHNLLHPVQWNHIGDREKFRKYFLKYEIFNLEEIEEIIREYNLDIVIIYKKLLKNNFDNNLTIPNGFILEQLNDSILLLKRRGID